MATSMLIKKPVIHRPKSIVKSANINIASITAPINISTAPVIFNGEPPLAVTRRIYTTSHLTGHTQGLASN